MNKKEHSTTLVIAVEKTISDCAKFLKIVTLLRKRFDFKFALAFKNPELLFFNKGLLSAVSKGQVERCIITNSPNYFWLDFLEFSKRQESDNLILCEMEGLIADCSSLIKLKVESAASSNSHLAFEKNYNSISISQSYLRELKSSCFNDLISTLKSLRSPNIDYSGKNSFTPAANPSLYVTKEGIDRFGGINQFLSSSLAIGDTKICEYKKLWEIDNDLTLDDYFKKNIIDLKNIKTIVIPGILNDGASSQVIVDINPGALPIATSDDTLEEKLTVPRMVLTITLVTEFEIVRKDTPAIFAMSNYNKASYLAGALYGIAMQTHRVCSIFIIDDISSDDSINVVNNFKNLIDSSKLEISFGSNTKSKGTYWIRNTIISSHIDIDGTYFVNDSDDISSCQRAAIQISILGESKKEEELCFGDIVRVDSSFALLPLDGKVERYGTASLCAPTSIHRKYGYYENIRKNADTEFIERLRHFSGKKATKWFRYPILFQPFDGNNLTSDIYSNFKAGKISENLSNRNRHKALFMENFKLFSLEDLLEKYTYPEYNLPSEYHLELKDFLI